MKLKNLFSSSVICILIQILTGCSSQESKLPNIIIFLADDLGYADVKWTNPKAYIETPNLIQLAKRGAILTDFYSASTMCSPSRAGLLTGRTPTRTGVHDWIKESYKQPYSDVHLPPEEITIAEILKNAGYQTAVMGKWHLNNGFRSGNQSDPDNQGFNYWFCTTVQSEPSHRNPVNFFENGNPVGEIGTEEDPLFSSGIVAEKTIKWLKGRKKGAPFFLYIAFHEPHVVCDAPDDLKNKYLDKISKGEIPLLENTGPHGLGQAEYYACVENMDHAIGKIISCLREEKELENTLILFTSDNGPDSNRYFQERLQSVGETGIFKGRKRWLYEGGIRQASIIVWPKVIKEGTKIQQEMGHIDILPTICEITGQTVPHDRWIDGINILPALRGQLLDRSEKPLHWHFYSPPGDSPRSVLREGPWVLTADWDQPRPSGRFDTSYVHIIKQAKLMDYKLYNITEDPGQQTNIQDEYPEIFVRMCEKLKELHSSVVKECPSSTQFQFHN